MNKPKIREYRYERKFRVEDLDVAQVRMLIKRHPNILHALSAALYQQFISRRAQYG